MKAAYGICEKMMQCAYADIWRECMELAQREDFHDIQAKYTVLLPPVVVNC